MTLVVVTDAVTPDGGPPAIQLTVTSTTSGPGPVPSGSRLVLWRIHADGSEHRVITSGDLRLISGRRVVFDYHAPFNVPVTYRAEAAGVQAVSAEDTSWSDSAWLIHPSEPALSVQPLAVRGIGDRSTDSLAGRFAPPGELPIFISEGRRTGLSGSMVFEVDDDQAVLALTEDDPMLLINTPGAGWRVRWLWVQPGQMGYVNEGRAYWPTELVSIPFEEGQEPTSDLINLWTAGVAAATFRAAGLTSAQVKLLYANANAAITDTRL